MKIDIFISNMMSLYIWCLGENYSEDWHCCIADSEEQARAIIIEKYGIYEDLLNPSFQQLQHPPYEVQPLTSGHSFRLAFGTG